MSDVLVAEHLYKEYIDAGERIVVLNDVSLRIRKGEMVAIVGSSGAGKTTLLQLLGSLDQPSAGAVQVAGVGLTGLNENAKARLRNRALGFVYQFHHLLPEFDALENVCMPLLLRGENRQRVQEKAIYYIEQVGLAHRLRHRVGELSGGERQRIAIARALVTEPQCVLADEPTGNLDPITATHITDLLITLNQRLRIAFVIVTHNGVLANQLHRICRLEGGKIQEL